MDKKSEEWTISYKQIGLILMSFSLGLIVALLMSNSQNSEITNFTSTELVGFVLSVILSGASIVLAIAAIALGKSSEQAVINRSDESIRLQTEVFTKTTDALQSIKSSTGVTEKRIEDIISGRAGDISRQIAESVSDETASGNIDVKELEEKIRKSITGTMEKEETEEEKQKKEERRKKVKERREIYEKNHEKLLYAIANLPGTKILKLGHGYPTKNDTSDYSKFDAVFEKANGNIAVSTFAPMINERYVISSMAEMISNLATSFEKDNMQELKLFFFEQNSEGDIFNAATQSIHLMKDKLKNKIKLIPIKYCELDKWIEENEQVTQKDK